MSRELVDWLNDIRTNIAHVRILLRDQVLDDIKTDWALRSAFERGLEIISEVSRHLPDDVKQRHGPEIAWRQIADMGNWLRHAYHRTNTAALWSIYVDDLDQLDVAISSIIQANPPAPSNS